eukprot:1738251-Amphidinium_carterae.1
MCTCKHFRRNGPAEPNTGKPIQLAHLDSSRLEGPSLQKLDYNLPLQLLLGPVSEMLIFTSSSFY